MRSIAIISLFALIAICSANRYQIQVKLVENGFETVNGTLKLIIGRNAFNSNIYRFNKTELRSGGVYTSAQILPEFIHQIKTVTLFWSLGSPVPPKYIISKPSIYLESVTLIPTYIQNEQFSEGATKRLCPRDWQRKIKTFQEASLQPC